MSTEHPETSSLKNVSVRKNQDVRRGLRVNRVTASEISSVSLFAVARVDLPNLDDRGGVTKNIEGPTEDFV